MASEEVEDESPPFQPLPQPPTFRDDTNRLSKRSMTTRDRKSAMWTVMAGKPKSWGAEEYKEMKQYFMKWYIEVLKRQHQTEHSKNGKPAPWEASAEGINSK